MSLASHNDVPLTPLSRFFLLNNWTVRRISSERKAPVANSWFQTRTLFPVLLQSRIIQKLIKLVLQFSTCFRTFQHIFLRKHNLIPHANGTSFLEKVFQLRYRTKLTYFTEINSTSTCKRLFEVSLTKFNKKSRRKTCHL